MEADELTPVMQDYLKVIWSAVEWGDPPITTTGLADRFGTSRANVSDVMRRLQAHGLVDYEPYRPVALTALGERLALAMVRRHRLIECFLADVLGYTWDEVHDDAERLEHAASERFLGRIDVLLGHPDADPHGDPIPTAEGHWQPPAGVVPLADAEPGAHLVARVSDADPAALARLEALGLRPGAPVTVRDGAPRYTNAVGVPLELGEAEERGIRVRPARD